MTGAYATGSGSVNIDTSENSEEARTKITDEVMILTLDALGVRGGRGGTAKEVAADIGLEKGRVSTAITNMYIVGRVLRLDERRANHYVHVLPERAHGRETIPYIPQKAHLRSEEAIVMAERLAAFLDDRRAFKNPPSMTPQPGDRELARFLRGVANVSRARRVRVATRQ